jgi:hypothetical protein
MQQFSSRKVFNRTRFHTARATETKRSPTQSRTLMYLTNLKVRDNKPIKEIYRSNSVMNIEIEEEMVALKITVVPERHFKNSCQWK